MGEATLPPSYLLSGKLPFYTFLYFFAHNCNSWSHKEHNPSPSQLLLTRFHAFRILESIVSETIWPFSIALQKKASLQFKFWIPFSLLKFEKFANR